MSSYRFDIQVNYEHQVHFTRGVFAGGNPLLIDCLEAGGGARVLVCVEEKLVEVFPSLLTDIEAYFAQQEAVEFCGVLVEVGGEDCKREEAAYRTILKEVESQAIDRHSYVVAVGGGAFLDVVGFAAATAHRGVRLVRVPTTTLSQDDSGVGVKCAVNYFNKKNWLGSFAVPYAVINDFVFLHAQEELVLREGLIEAVKVALVRDRGFFEWIEANVKRLAAVEPAALEECVERSAVLHAQHIAEGGDPFEHGSSRPLDFGHWAAHKLEQLTDYALSHAQAVAIGVVLDTVYSEKTGLLDGESKGRILAVLRELRLLHWHDALLPEGGKWQLLDGIEEFREHLGGRLTIMLLRAIGQGEDVHAIDKKTLRSCIVEMEEGR